MAETNDDNIYLECEFDKRDEIKAFGFFWDKDKRMWRRPAIDPVSGNPFQITLPMRRKFQKIYLNSRFSDKDSIKELGGRWDSEVKKWYVPAGYEKEPFMVWISEDQKQELWPLGTEQHPINLSEVQENEHPPPPSPVSSNSSSPRRKTSKGIEKNEPGSEEEMVLLEIPKRLLPKSFYPYILSSHASSSSSNKRRK